MSIKTDVLVVGSGAAGLSAALNLAESHKVAVIAKGALSEGATVHAQGGIAAVLEEGDSFEAHINDTMIAGAGLNNPKVVEHVVENAPAVIARLIELGVPFATDGDALASHPRRRSQPSAHRPRRRCHRLCHPQALESAAKRHPNISLVPDMVAVDLITGRHSTHFSTSGAVHGLYAYDRAKKRVENDRSSHHSCDWRRWPRLSLFRTAPHGATGDGIAMAWRAGCRVSNMEFMQFHPTCLYNLEVKNFLITEAVRGEGGILKHPVTGRRFMADYDPRAEARPRDIVARAIDQEIKRDGLDYVHLDISHREPEFVSRHFPNIYEKLIGLGIDITKEPIPVVPAQHYTCGGVVVDLDGRTDAAGLYAAGEVTQSGLHGANRLASNSLLECLVFGEAAARHIVANWGSLPNVPDLRPWDESRVTDSDEEVVIAQIGGNQTVHVELCRHCSNDEAPSERAKHRIDMLSREVKDYYAHFRVTPDLIELRNLVEVADLIIKSALSRHESRGLHFTLDYPAMLASPKDTILVP